MESLVKKLLQIKDLCKMLKPKTVDGGRNMPTMDSLSKPPSVKPPAAPKLPGTAEPSKVNPVKSAEQIQNKDIKDIKMKEAQSALSAKPKNLTKQEYAEGKHITFHKNGQWSID